MLALSSASDLPHPKWRIPTIDYQLTFIQGADNECKNLSSPSSDNFSQRSSLMQIVSQQVVELETSCKQLTEQQQPQRAEKYQRFRQQLAELPKREQTCQTEREAWHKERMQVEQLIRELVQQTESAFSTVS